MTADDRKRRKKSPKIICWRWPIGWTSTKIRFNWKYLFLMNENTFRPQIKAQNNGIYPKWFCECEPKTKRPISIAQNSEKCISNVVTQSVTKTMQWLKFKKEINSKSNMLYNVSTFNNHCALDYYKVSLNRFFFIDIIISFSLRMFQHFAANRLDLRWW